MTSFDSVGAVIFDFDGVVCDSERLWCELLTEVYAGAGVVFPHETFIATIGGTSADFDPFELLAHSRPDRNALEWSEWCHELFDYRVLDELALPGVRDLWCAAQDEGWGIAVASNASVGRIESFLVQTGLIELVDVLVHNGHGAAPKPAPDLYRLAADMLGIPPRAAVAFDDSWRGVRAAKDSGARCVAVRTSLTRTHDLSEADARVLSLRDVSIHDGVVMILDRGDDHELADLRFD